MKAIVLVALAGLGCITTTAYAGNDALRIGRVIYKEVNEFPPTTHDPVIRSLSTCLGNNGSIAGMDKCYQDAGERYEAILNGVYHVAIQSASDKTKDALRRAQRRWLTFRKAEQELHAVYAEGRGTVMVPVIGENDLSLIRTRIAELMMYTGFREG